MNGEVNDGDDDEYVLGEGGGTVMSYVKLKKLELTR
jgi:hypothetical protein